MTRLHVGSVTSDRRGRSRLTVEADGRTVATVEVSRVRRSVEDHVSQAATNARVRGSTAADPLAWSAEAASQAAQDRWADPHPAIRTVGQLRLEGDEHTVAEVLEAAGIHLAEQGVRRLDVRTSAASPLSASVRGARWVQGRVDGDVVASLAVTYPWAAPVNSRGRLQRLLAPLPPRLQRSVRRAAAIRPAQVPELARSAATEVAVGVRRRSAPGAPRSTPTGGAPAGTHPFAASRYRTVRAALSFVPASLRSGPFLDVGCGDGRVLREALAAGFPRADGRELDPDLARHAQAAVGDDGFVEVGDALATPLGDVGQVIFLNNPFDGTVLERFSQLVADTLERNPRPLLVLYLNPRPIEPLLAAGLVLVQVDPRFSVLASGSRS